MLAADHRVTDAAVFRAVTRSGRRGSAPTVVVHVLTPSVDGSTTGSRAGFVVGKSVGNSVVRHRVQRRLRHLLRERWHQLPDASLVVVRALPAAASADSAALGRDLSTALRRASTATDRVARTTR